MKLKESLPLFAFISLLLVNCDEEKKKLDITSFAAPTVSVNQVSVSDKAVAVELSGSFTVSGVKSTVSDCGFYYYPEGSVEQEKKVQARTESGNFSSTILLNDYGTSYRYRAYISNGVNEKVSEELGFRLLELKDYVNMSVPEVVNSNGSSVTVRSLLTAAAGVNPTENGFLYGRSEQLTIDSLHTPAVLSDADITATINGLSIAQSYYFRPYIREGDHIAYGSSVAFTTHSVPSVSTTSVSGIDGSSATSGGNSLSGNGFDITTAGIVWSESHNPTIENSSVRYIDTQGNQDYICQMTDLKPNTVYYIRAFAMNSDGVGYGEELTFTTLAVAPTVSTSVASSVTSSSAVLGGNVTDSGGAEVTERGIVWSTSVNPTIDDSKKSSGIGTGEYSITLTGLSFATTFYVRAYAINSVGISYGSQITFTTGTVLPSLSTTAVSSITSSSAVSGGNISSDGGAVVTERGIVWSTEKNPTVGLSTRTINGIGAGEFTSKMTGLEYATVYYVRAYASNSVGTAYGEELTFTTLAVASTVITFDASDVTSSSAVLGGNVTDWGGAEVTERGIVWSTSDNPTIDDNKKSSGSGTGEYSITLTGLSFATTYYVRAYAINSAGISYGSQITFTTGTVLPTLSTTAVSSVTSSSAVSGGNISSDGGAVVTERGIVWSTEKNPTVGLSTKTTNGSGMGKFTATITGLDHATLYYVRAYATNSVGTAYGEELSFKTLAAPTVITVDISDVTSSSAVL
ncbi:MAG: hypothetical protein J6X21_01410, partial [Bacteroidaceae bacterium]|nr:hypothetical protein [Bacteroidaceae bacterium]